MWKATAVHHAYHTYRVNDVLWLMFGSTGKRGGSSYEGGMLLIIWYLLIWCLSVPYKVRSMAKLRKRKTNSLSVYSNDICVYCSAVVNHLIQSCAWGARQYDVRGVVEHVCIYVRSMVMRNYETNKWKIPKSHSADAIGGE